MRNFDIVFMQALSLSDKVVHSYSKEMFELWNDLVFLPFIAN